MASLKSGVLQSNTFPSLTDIFRSGSNALNIPSTILPKPLNTDSTHTIAMVAMAIPHTEIIEITLIALCDFLEKRYLRAIKKETFIVVLAFPELDVCESSFQYLYY